jgi:hypothetical protein
MASSLLFACSRCGEGLYSLYGGSSNGTAGHSVNFPCFPCPSGGLCSRGGVTATSHHWGDSDGSGKVSFAVCPTGYCCDDTTMWKCTAIDTCGGNRGGPLCGTCLPGYTEALGSATCALVDRCSNDTVLLWSLVSTALVVIAFIQLGVVSQVWATLDSAPSGRMKLLIYYAQVRWVHVLLHLHPVLL